MNNKEQNMSADASIFIGVLSATFQPAVDADHATHWFSTSEIYEAIKDIDPGCTISKDDIHDAMLSAGYWYQSRPGASGLQFRWMLQAK